MRPLPLLALALAVLLPACDNSDDSDSAGSDPDETATDDTATDDTADDTADDTGTDDTATDTTTNDTADDIATDDTATDDTATDADPVSWALGLFAAVPDEPQYLEWAMAANFERAAEAAGVTTPLDADASEQWAGPVLADPDGPRAATPGFGMRAAEFDTWTEEFGFTVAETTAAAEVGNPPEQLRVYDVTVSDNDIDAAVRADPTWSDMLVDEEIDGTPVYVWQPDGEADVSRTSAARPLGRGGTMAVSDGRVVRAVTRDTLEATLTVEPGSSLADRDDVRTILGALDEAGVHSLALTSEAPTPSTALRNATAEQLAAATPDVLVAPYELLGVGGAFDDGATTTVIALWHADADAAAENADRLDQILTEGSSAISSRRWSDIAAWWTIETDGQLLTAELEHPQPLGSFWYQLVSQRDSLLWVDDGES